MSLTNHIGLTSATMSHVMAQIPEPNLPTPVTENEARVILDHFAKAGTLFKEDREQAKDFQALLAQFNELVLLGEEADRATYSRAAAFLNSEYSRGVGKIDSEGKMGASLIESAIKLEGIAGYPPQAQANISAQEAQMLLEGFQASGTSGKDSAEQAKDFRQMIARIQNGRNAQEQRLESELKSSEIAEPAIAKTRNTIDELNSLGRFMMQEYKAGCSWNADYPVSKFLVNLRQIATPNPE